MAVGSSLQNALEAFAALEREIVKRGQHIDAATASELVQLRQRLALQFGVLANALEKDSWLQSEPALMREANRLVSAFRSEYSFAMASWPVVRAKDDASGYDAAVHPVGERSLEFWNWVERQLGFKR